MSDLDIELTEMIVNNEFLYRFWVLEQGGGYLPSNLDRFDQVHPSLRKAEVIRDFAEGLM